MDSQTLGDVITHGKGGRKTGRDGGKEGGREGGRDGGRGKWERGREKGGREGRREGGRGRWEGGGRKEKGRRYIHWYKLCLREYLIFLLLNTVAHK